MLAATTVCCMDSRQQPESKNGVHAQRNDGKRRSELANQSLSAQVLVDGSPVVADAEFSTGWKNGFLPAATIRGQRRLRARCDSILRVLALDCRGSLPLLGNLRVPTTAISDIRSGTPHNRKNEHGGNTSIMSNGYNSTAENAAPFIFFAEDGKAGWSGNYVKISTCSAFPECPWQQRLSTPVVNGLRQQRTVDFIYAGDLKRNLWKFDVRSGTSSSWAVATIKNAGSASSSQQPLSWPAQIIHRAVSGGKETGDHQQAGGNHWRRSHLGDDLRRNRKISGVWRSSTTQQQSVYGVPEKISSPQMAPFNL